jgi:hypothetical protein
MPQTIAPRVHRTITLAANDLCTVSYAGTTPGSVYVKNTGPGVVWLSFDSTKPATVGDVNNMLLKVGDFVTFTGLARNSVFTLNADTAATIVTMSFSIS